MSLLFVDNLFSFYTMLSTLHQLWRLYWILYDYKQTSTLTPVKERQEKTDFNPTEVEYKGDGKKPVYCESSSLVS